MQIGRFHLNVNTSIEIHNPRAHDHTYVFRPTIRITPASHQNDTKYICILYMSQSDYIQFKSLKNNLLYQNKLDPILDSQDYTRFVKYSIETSIPNTKLVYNQLIPPKQLFHPLELTDNAVAFCNVFTHAPASILGPGKTLIFNMEQSTDGCPTFIECSNTNSRPNRVTTKNATLTRIPVTPVPKYVKIKPTTKCSFQTKYRTRICVCDNKKCKCGINICSSKYK